MSGTIDSCHSKELSIKKQPNPQRKRIIAGMKIVSVKNPERCSYQVETRWCLKR